MNSTKKAKFQFMTVLAFVLVIVAVYQLNQLRIGPADSTSVLGWGFVMIFGCIFFVRGIFAVNKIK